MKNGRRLVLGAAVLWGTTGTAQALAPANAEPLAVGALRLAVGGGALLLLAVLRGAFKGGGRWPLVATGLAAASMAAYQPLFFAGVNRAGVAVGTIITIGSSPLLAGLLARLFRGERLSMRWVAATVLAVTGGILLTTNATSAATAIDPLGVLLALGAGLSYATYAVSSKNVLAHHPPDAVIAVVFSVAALALSPLLLTANLGWVLEWNGALAVLHLGLFATALAYFLFARGLQHTPVATAVTLSLAEPLTATLLGLFLLGEHLTGPMLVGVGLLFAGLVILTVNFPLRAESAAIPR